MKLPQYGKQLPYYLLGEGEAIFSFELEFPTTETSGDLEPQPVRSNAEATESATILLLALTITTAYTP